MISMLHMSGPGPETRDGFRFRGGHPVLDFTATLSGRLKASQKDQWQVAEDVARWCMAAGLAGAAPVVAPGDLAAARALREDIYRLVNARIAGEAFDAAALDRLNHMAEGVAAVPVLAPSGAMTLSGTLAEFLALIAREAVLLLGSEAAERLRRCEGNGCAVLFLDTSRAGDRRWCSMSACGNRAKVAEFRRRKREEASGGKP